MFVMATAFRAVPCRIDGATFRICFLSRTVMITAGSPSSLVRDDSHPPCDGARTRARSWTGRAAVSCSTDSSVPKFSTIATHKTRVSEMRLLSGTSDAFDVKGSVVPVIPTVQRTVRGYITHMRMPPRFGRHASG